jgi:hypothetical protein
MWGMGQWAVLFAAFVPSLGPGRVQNRAAANPQDNSLQFPRTNPTPAAI